MARRNRLLVPSARNALEQMKQEIAQEFGVKLDADTPSRLNGAVGGEMVTRLVALGQQQLANTNNNKQSRV
ncbi:MAG: alpha/beta-type small acid-soluble spore protein [Bacilli bacterium]|nr:alpha/beta-type small acid-soluble spore protein [Bacilli bacterium]